MIKSLVTDNPDIWNSWQAYVREVEAISKFVGSSGVFPRTGRGKIDLYSAFAELGSILSIGATGLILKHGIITDYSNQHFFASELAAGHIQEVSHYRNEEGLFPAVNRDERFVLLSLNKNSRDGASFLAAFFLSTVLPEEKSDKQMVLTKSDVDLVNPNTGTCPIYRGSRDATISRTMYMRAPVLVNEKSGSNPWRSSFRQGLFNMTSDSDHFKTLEDLIDDGWILQGNTFTKTGHSPYLPLYEAKLFHQFNHRLGTFAGVPRASRFGMKAAATAFSESVLADPEAVTLPRYWVPHELVLERIGGQLTNSLLVYRKLINVSTNRRTAVFSLLPAVGTSDSACVVMPDVSNSLRACLIASLNSFVVDYAARQKVGGNNLSLFILQQIPVLPPDTYTEDLLDLIVPRVLELTYTAHDMEPFARDLGYEGPPFVWDEDRRAKLQADLDGIYAHLYGISREDFAYILDSFDIVARKDIERHGEYRTKRRCLEAYDHFAPETLRALELEVRAIEQALRRVIVQALANDAELLPAPIRDEIVEERAKHRPGSANEALPPLRELLESAYLRHLDKIIRSELWPRFEPEFQSRADFKRHFYKLNAFRNPLAHGRGMSEDVRTGGEAAIAWFRGRLATAATR